MVRSQRENSFVLLTIFPVVVVHEVILASAIDKSRYLAVRRAASVALDALHEDADFLTRTCDCRESQQSGKRLSKVLLGYEDVEGSKVDQQDNLA